VNRSKLNFIAIIGLLVLVSGLWTKLGSVMAREGQDLVPRAVTVGPQLIAEFKPQLVTVNTGETATFTIEITNTGPLALDSIAVTESPVASCNRADVGALAAGQSTSYTCEKTNMTENLVNEILVTGQSGGAEAISRAGAFVKVRKSVLAIEKRPVNQTVKKGETARFTIVLFNLSSDIVLTNVTVDDNIANGCDLNPMIPLNLAPGESKDYLCNLPNVQAPQTTVATAQGTNPANNQVFTDNFAAWVHLLGITAAMSPEPAAVPEPGGLITYTITLTNPGSFAVTLSELTTDQYGNLLDPTNGNVNPGTNSCLTQLDLPTIQPYGGTYTCAFEAAATGQPPEIVVALTAKAKSAANVEVISTTTASVGITNVPAEISITGSPEPPFISPPGRVVTFNIQIDNESEADAVTITALDDSVLGDVGGQGSCQLPQTIQPGSSFQCAYTDTVQGQAGEEVSRMITASGEDDDLPPSPVSASTTVTVGITNQVTRVIYMPSVSDDSLGARCGDPYPLQVNRQYNFLPPLPYSPPANQGNFFKYTINQRGNVRIELTKFVPEEGQLIVWTNNCGTLVRNTNTSLNKTLDLGQQESGTYIIQLINDGSPNNRDTYGLLVRVN
jgi:uncharacterized repeat protein (TIGR01451 family)